MTDNAQIAALRMVNQQLIASDCVTVQEVVARMGAMQAQDANMVKWAVGIRLPGSTDELVEKAIEAGDILRTHLMRPTWHYVASHDIHWMLRLTAPQIKTQTKSRDKELELTEALYAKCNTIIENAIAEQGHLTRDELIPMLHTANIRTDENRASHILMRAELDGIVCSGKPKAAKQTYALLSERASHSVSFNRDEALAQLAQRYFRSHGPATLHDFSWWSGLTLRDVRRALDMVQSQFVSEMIQEKVYLFSPGGISLATENTVSVLPAYDEFLISYRDRTASLPTEINAKAVSNNGIFRPVIIVDGCVAGVWKRTAEKGRVVVEVDFFRPVNRDIRQKVTEAFAGYSVFLRKDVVHR